jgi:hypothetical protein
MYSLVRHDVEKARAVLARQPEERLRQMLLEHGHDDFVRAVTDVVSPAITLGTAETAAGTTVPVRIPVSALAAHMAIIGTTDAGKSSFASILMDGLLRHGVGVGVADFKTGLFTDAIARTAAIAYRLPPSTRQRFTERVVTLHPSDEEYLQPLNIVQAPAGVPTETACYETARVLEEVSADVGFHMKNIALNGLLLAGELTRTLGISFTILELIRIVKDESFRSFCVAESRHPQIREFFGRFATIPQASKDALLTRLEALVLFENLRLALGADDCLDTRAIFDQSKPFFLYLGRDGTTAEDLLKLFANLVLLRLFQAAFAGGGGRQQPYLLFLDEPFHVLTPSLSEKLTLALASLRAHRAFVATILHHTSQLDGRLRDALLNLCTLMAIFRTQPRSAQSLGEFLPDIDREVVRESLRRTGKAPGRFEFRTQMQERLERMPRQVAYWYDKRRPYRAFRFKVADVHPPHTVAGCSAEELTEFIESSGLRRGGGLPKFVLRRQIAERERRLHELMHPPIVVPATEPLVAIPGRRSRVG